MGITYILSFKKFMTKYIKSRSRLSSKIFVCNIQDVSS